jgi:adenosylcobinamide-GDP ribazoletransferase
MPDNDPTPPLDPPPDSKAREGAELPATTAAKLPATYAAPAAATRPLVAELGWFAEFHLAASFLTRIPLHLAPPAEPVGSAVRGFPLVGLVIGLAGAAVFALADTLALASAVSALLAITALALVTGGLHEDGLADFADGLGGGKTREEKLEIMRDSRIGSYGVLALILAVGLRVSALSNTTSAAEAVLLMVAAGAMSRACIPTLMYVLPPARREGLSWMAGLPEQRRVVDAGALGVVAGVLLLGPIAGVIAAAAAALAAAAIGIAAKRQLGGQTGDVLGAGQQAAEIAVMIVYLALPL